MENNHDEPPKQEPENNDHRELSPTVRYQYEESKGEEQKHDQIEKKENSIDDQPIITDETSPRHQTQHLNSDNDTEIIREVFPNNQAENQNNPANEVNENATRLEQEFYQHNLQTLVANLNNLRDILQTIVTNPEIAQNLNPTNVNPAVGQPSNNNIGNLWNNPLQQPQNANNFFDLAGLNNNVVNENINNQPTFNIRIREYLRSQSRNISFYLNVISAIAVLILFSSISFLPHLEGKTPAYFVHWLANHRNSKLFLIVNGIMLS